MANNPDLSGSDTLATQAKSTGENAINSFDPVAVGATQQTNTGALGTQLAGQTNKFVSDYADTVAKNPTVTSLYNTANNMFNVPQLATNATNLTNRVTNLTPNAYQGARGFDIDKTDIDNGIANSSAYLTPQANAATANYNTAAGLASNFVQAGQAQNAQNLLPIQAQAPLLMQSEAAQATGWNNAAQSEFQGLIDKMNAGVTLSGQEMQRANTLAQLEESYQQQLTQNQTSMNTANIANQYKVLPQGNNLVNTFTNTMVNPSMLTARTGAYKG